MDATRGVEMTAMLARLGRAWGWIVAYGVATLLAGVIAVVWPSSTLVVIAIIFAVQLLVVAIYLFAHVGLTLLVLATVIGIYWIALGVIELFLAIGHSGIRWRPWIGFTGILSIVAGGVVVIYPVSSLFFLTIFLGFWLVIFGVTLIVRGVGLRSAAQMTKRMVPGPAA